MTPDGDGQYDADEIRQYGTLMYNPETRQSACRIDCISLPNPADMDADGLPDDWEMGFFGTLDRGPDDDPEGDGFPNRIEFGPGSVARGGRPCGCRSEACEAIQSSHAGRRVQHAQPGVLGLPSRGLTAGCAR